MAIKYLLITGASACEVPAHALSQLIRLRDAAYPFSCSSLLQLYRITNSGVLSADQYTILRIESTLFTLFMYLHKSLLTIMEINNSS